MSSIPIQVFEIKADLYKDRLKTSYFELGVILKKPKTFFYLIFLFIVGGTSTIHGLVLEELLQNETLESTLQHKKIGYFLGSFDPVHKAHEGVIQSVLKQGLCDYVIVYPVWGGDIYKVRSNIQIRLDMLFALFEDHPQVIVTCLPPKALQDALTISSPAAANQIPAYYGTEFIGILGSDTALYLAPNPETSLVYMTGLKVSEEYQEHTWGCCMALPVNSFIVALRSGDDIQPLQGKIRERAIIATIENKNESTLSSTGLKKALKNGESIDTIVSCPIIDLIKNYQLYTNH